jgi:conjugative transfer signal peptidase TraF
MGHDRWRARWWVRHPWALPLLFLLLSWLHPLGLRINGGSHSQPRGVYWLVPGEPARGQLVLVRLPADLARFGVARGYLDHPEMAKCVAALPGDTVEVTSRGLAVNGAPIHHTAPLTRDSQGRPLTPLPMAVYDTLPGSLWLYSNFIPNSWDSRYFGPVSRGAVRGRLVPLVTWPPFRHNPYGGTTCNWQPTNS